MKISDYQIGSVIKTYMKNMKVQVRDRENGSPQETRNDVVAISQEGMKKVLHDRIDAQTAERPKKYDQT
jgi:protein tyrosine phosphatase (PTP) superfamily phosphohydrolase (DUF442 family)